MLNCVYCKKEYKTTRSCTNHEHRCPKNPSRVYTNGMLGKKGLTSNAQTMSAAEREARQQKVREAWLAKYLATPFDQLGMENRRRRVLEEQDHRCNKCGISEWQGVKITLELDHIDGNTQNNARLNLEGLCPNCHSITDTWRGRNKPSRNGVSEVTDSYLLQCLREASNIRQGLLRAGLAAKGNNYARAKKLLGM